MFKKYRIKQIIVSAVEWTGSNVFDIAEFMDGNECNLRSDGVLNVLTHDGYKLALVGDYITLDDRGRFDVCESYMFDEVYERHIIWDENL